MGVRVVIKSQVFVSNASAIFERQTLTTNERTGNRPPTHPASNENMIFSTQIDRKSTPPRRPDSNENMFFLAQVDRKSTPEF